METNLGLLLQSIIVLGGGVAGFVLFIFLGVVVFVWVTEKSVRTISDTLQFLWNPDEYHRRKVAGEQTSPIGTTFETLSDDKRKVVTEAVPDKVFSAIALDIFLDYEKCTAPMMMAAYTYWLSLLDQMAEAASGVPFKVVGRSAGHDYYDAVGKLAVYCEESFGLSRRFQDGVPEELREGTPVKWSVLLETPFWPLLENQHEVVYLKEQSRFEHTWILGPQGSGKTQLMKYMIAEDIKELRASVIVIDSQGDLARSVATLKEADPLMVLIEPGSVGLNPFALKGEKAIELLTFVFAALGDGATLTPKQETLYRYCIRLLQEIPGATLKTFMEILSNGTGPYGEYIRKLSEPAQSFFRDQFPDAKQFGTTKQEVAWRLALVLESPVFEQMFCSTDMDIDFFHLTKGIPHIIVVDTSKQELGTDRSALFGRFIIACIIQASHQRADLPLHLRTPCYVYIDEAQEYLQDDKVAELLDQARKMKIGMVLANQRSQQIKNPNMLDALLTTTVKFVHTDNDRDTHLLARPMNTTPEAIAGLKKESFMLHVRNEVKAGTPVWVPHLVMEKMEHMTIEEAREASRLLIRYSNDEKRYDEERRRKSKPRQPDPPRQEEPKPQAKPEGPSNKEEPMSTKPGEW